MIQLEFLDRKLIWDIPNVNIVYLPKFCFPVNQFSAVCTTIGITPEHILIIDLEVKTSVNEIDLNH